MGSLRHSGSELGPLGGAPSFLSLDAPSHRIKHPRHPPFHAAVVSRIRRQMPLPMTRMPLRSSGLVLSVLLAACGSQQTLAPSPSKPDASRGSPATAATAAPDKASNLHTACERKDARACFDLAVLMEEDSGAPKDEARVRALYKKACDGGDLRGCIKLHTDACDRGEALGCAALAEMAESGKGVSKDPNRALELYIKACDGGHLSSCTKGLTLIDGAGVEKNDARAAALYGKACDGGSLASCTVVGNLYADGRGVAKDEARAAALYEKACDGGNLGGCTSLGNLYADGRGVAKDEARAVALYEKACDAGDSFGCNYLGNMVSNGRGVAKDVVRAMALYEKACDAGNPFGCHLLGFGYKLGYGVAKNEARALVLLATACEGHVVASCYDLGILAEDLLRRGLSNKDEGHRLAKLGFDEACKLGDKKGCEKSSQFKP
ncbi:SEL1-like repeat protein [Polyangium sp. 6x1]|uniref:tetratricopeptide repeat protein n=1 Tax=Polyangium sp. 6x1 TaxID=3042689 RepID=UPI002482ED19|nr:SEL1-like repeat protein [Polyangium sp. 6x1]MDI1444160.1 SEL1-like repeat protein [Polyangium sp. 6x1]